MTRVVTETWECLRKKSLEKNGAVRIGSRRWPQECQSCGLVKEKGGTTPVSYAQFKAAGVLTLDGVSLKKTL